jgi:hypothetical protein
VWHPPRLSRLSMVVGKSQSKAHRSDTPRVMRPRKETLLVALA